MLNPKMSFSVAGIDTKIMTAHNTISPSSIHTRPPPPPSSLNNTNFNNNTTKKEWHLVVASYVFMTLKISLKRFSLVACNELSHKFTCSTTEKEEEEGNIKNKQINFFDYLFFVSNCYWCSCCFCCCCCHRF